MDSLYMQSNYVIERYVPSTPTCTTSVASPSRNLSTSGQLFALMIGIGSFVYAIWLWSGIGDWCREYWTFLRKAALINGPPALPMIGNVLYFIGDPNEYLNKVMKLTNIYTTPLRIWLGPRLVILISEPSDIETLMKSPHAKQKSSEYYFMEKVTGPGLLTSSGPTQTVHRNMIMPMVNGRVLDEFMNSFETQSRRCVDCLKAHVDSEEFDIKRFLDDWSIDIALEAILGVSGTVQQGGYIEFTESILRLNSLAYERIMKVWLHPDWIYSFTRSGREWNKGGTVLRKFVDDIRRKQKIPELLLTSVLLDQLIVYNEEHQLMNDSELAAELTTMFLTAQEPPALTTSFMLLMLAMHPEIQDKVRAEVQDVIGDDIITTRNLVQLKYLDMVIKETLRLFPIGVVFTRRVTDDVKFSSFTAPKGCTIGMFLFKTHRDPKLWKDPNKFDPDRFSPENLIGRHPYAFLPFSSGTRGCIGKYFGTMMMKTVVVEIVRNYRLHSNGSLEELRVFTNLFTQSLDGWKMSITRL